MKDERKLVELVWEMPGALRNLGLAVSTIGEYMRGYSWVLNYHTKRGAEYFDRDIVTEYVRHVEQCCDNGSISKGEYNNYMRAARQLTEYHGTGKLEWTMRGRVSKFVLNDYYENLLAGLLARARAIAKKSNRYRTSRNVI
jgi:hypothetical protein